MKSALQLELQDLHGLPFVAGIIWFVLLGICLLAILIYLAQRNLMPKKPKKAKHLDFSSKNKSQPKGF